MKRLIFTLVSAFIAVWGHTQNCRYLDEVFSDVQLTKDIVYGINATALTVFTIGEASPEPLMLDVYEPEGDTDTIRPLIIVFHSGNFFPFPQNGSPVGTRRDSSVVEICRRLARSGYVVASADYRLGWNPATPNPTELTIGLINAAYRGVQDANTCIRYFKKTMVEDNNPYKIDTCRIVLFGDDTGGYLSLNAGALDRYSKIPETDQFCIPPGDPNCFPMVVEYLSGDVEGKIYGVNTPPVPGFPFPPGDTLCYPNHVAYSSKFSVSISLAGAVGDTSWMEPGQPPVIAVQVPYDYTTPYECGLVVLGDGTPVIHVCGSYAVAVKANQLGTNSDIMPGKYCDTFQSGITDVALGRSGGLEGLLAIYGDTITDINPWDFWDCETNANCGPGLETNPNMSYEKADTYIDTILAYVWPRLYQALSLDIKIHPDCEIINTEDIITDDVAVVISPNPSSGEITLSTPEAYIIRNITVHDMKGTMVASVSNINGTSHTIYTTDYASGIYLVRMQFDQGIAARRFVVQ